jgi:hypothetical protein
MNRMHVGKQAKNFQIAVDYYLRKGGRDEKIMSPSSYFSRMIFINYKLYIIDKQLFTDAEPNLHLISGS